MRRAVMIAVLMGLLLVSIAWSQTKVTYFNKNNIDKIAVFYSITSKYYVVVTLLAPVDGYDGFYYYEFANLEEAAMFADMFRRGRIRAVEHYDNTTGHKAGWFGKTVYVIVKFFCK